MYIETLNEVFMYMINLINIKSVYTIYIKILSIKSNLI